MNGARLGIDIGGTAVKAALLRGDNTRTAISATYERPTLEALAEAVRGVCDELGAPGDAVGVGVALVGVVDEAGVVTAATNLPALVGVVVGSWLRNTLDLECEPVVTSDACAAAMAEWHARPVGGRAMYLSIGAGVGGVVLDGGEALDVTRGTPGHLGHIDVSGGEAGAPVAADGGRGSLEAYVGSAARGACGAWGEAAFGALARGLRVMLAMYRPDEIVLLGGGGLGLCDELQRLRSAVTDGLTHAAPAQWRLRCGEIGRCAAAIGAAQCAPATGTLPADRAHVLTEQRNARSGDLHRLSTGEVAALINAEDQTVAAAVGRGLPTITAFVEAAEPKFARGGRLIYVGAGTSGRLGVLDASEMPPTFQVDPGKVVGIIAGGDRSLRRSSEGKEDDERGAVVALDRLALTDDDSVVGIAAGGTTRYVRGAIGYAKQVAPGCNTALLTCAPVERPVGADHMIVIETGAEVVTGSTRMKAGTATKLALNTISTTLMVRSGRVYENLMVDLRASNAKLRDRAARIIVTLAGLEREAAFALLDKANGEVKPAIVMQRLGVSYDEARRLLDDAGSRIGDVLERRDG